MYIPYGQWLPDQPEYLRQGALDATNVAPFTESYKPLKQGVVWSSNGLDGECLGSASFIRPDGNVVTFAGDGGKLYRLETKSFVDVSKTGGYNASGNVWRFVQWGEYIFATNFNDPIQKFNMATDSQFSDLSPTAPRCRDMAIVNEFLVLAHTVDTIDGERENRIWWSPIGDPFGTWTAGNATTLSDFQDLVDGNYCVGIAGGDYGTILMRNSIIKMTFVGPPLAFQIDTIEPVRGCIGINAFATDGRIVYYLAPEGFFAFNGANSVAIGANKVDNHFWTDIDDAYYQTILCGLDPINKLVIWAYSSDGNEGVINKWLVYNWTNQWWSTANWDDPGDTPITRFSPLYTQGYTLDGLDVVSTDIDTGFTLSFDDPFWKGGFPIFGGFGADNKLYYFTGDNKNATLTPAEVQLSPEKRSFVQSVRMIVEGGTNTLQIAQRQTLNDTVTYGGMTSPTNSGKYSSRSAGRYHRFKCNLTGTWTHARGLEVEARTEGKR